jgi:repressor LexA
MLTAKQRELLMFIDARPQGERDFAKLRRDARGAHLKSKSGVHRLISALEERASSAGCPIVLGRSRW